MAALQKVCTLRSRAADLGGLSHKVLAIYASHWSWIEGGRRQAATMKQMEIIFVALSHQDSPTVTTVSLYMIKFWLSPISSETHLVAVWLIVIM